MKPGIHHFRRVSQGFTLLELLIAMVIFATMSLMAYGGLANMLNSNEATQQYEQELKLLQRSMMFMERDFRQLAPRPRRDDFSRIIPALQSGLDTEGLIEFSRAGNPNPANQRRSSLQRVRYEVRDNQLFRLSWNLVDHSEETNPVTMPLLPGIESIRFEFNDKNNIWQENWGSQTQLLDLPRAIKISIEHKRWGKIERIILIL